MDAAQDRITSEIVEAEDLKLLEHVDTYGYICHGHECGIPAYPRSYRPENLLRAHFYVKTQHAPSCDVAGENELRSRGKRVSVANELETIPGLSPSGLQLVDSREVSDDHSLRDRVKSESSPRFVSEDQGNQRKPIGRRPANSIRPICRAFTEFPYDRHLPLHINGIETRTYQTVFKKLPNDGLQIFPRRRIFYAELAWQAAQNTAEELIVPLNAGEWHEKKLKPYTIVIQWAQWSKTARTRLRNEVEIARRENITAKKSKSTKRTYVFFIGDQNSTEPSQFIVSDHRLICTIHGRLIFPRH